MGAVDFVDDNFGGSIGMIAEKASERCANGDCFDQSAMMAANVVANVAEELDVDDAARDVFIVFEEETEDVLEDNERWADWIGSFVSGLMNRADERKGEREDVMSWDDEERNSYYNSE